MGEETNRDRVLVNSLVFPVMNNVAGDRAGVVHVINPAGRLPFVIFTELLCVPWAMGVFIKCPVDVNACMLSLDCLFLGLHSLTHSLAIR